MRLTGLLQSLTRSVNFLLKEKVTQKRVVLFLLPSQDQISGGIISVISIYRELKKLEHKLGINVYLSTHPQATAFTGYTKHNKDVKIYGFHQLLNKLLVHTTVLFHVPESHVVQFCSGLNHAVLTKIKEDKKLVYDVNILNQNPDFFPKTAELAPLLLRIRNLTQTTAHYAYNKPFKVAATTVPSSYLGTYPGTDTYEIVPFKKKRNTILVSHDYHPQKQRILKALETQFPELEIIVVKDMTFEEYNEHQKYCKFGISFGEGMDSYFLTCILYGGIGFAVNNNTFFTDDIRAFSTVFNSYQELEAAIATKITALNTATAYTNLVNSTRSVVGKYYNNAYYKRRIEHIHSNWLKDAGCIATKELLAQG